jgi:hypothetical protein
LRNPVGDLGELEQVVSVRLEADEHDGPRVGVLLVHDRLVDFLRKPPRTRDTMSRTSCAASFDRAVEVKFEIDIGALLRAAAGHRTQAFERRELLLQHIGHRGLHHLRIGSAQGHGHRDDRRIDIGELPDRELPVSDDAEQDERGARHAGEDRPLDGNVGEVHATDRPRQ